MMNSSKIELLNKENFDTWKLQMKAVLIKNDLWSYVAGDIVKPEPNDANPNSVKDWTKNDQKAMSDIILSISSSELKQIKNCLTSGEIWKRLQEIYESKGPARKATLLKKLTLMRMTDGEDVRSHLNEFFDAVDKLHDMDVILNSDQLTIMLLYSLPNKFENFRVAIESRDDLPTPEALRVKIIEEYDAHKNCTQTRSSNALLTNENTGRSSNDKKREVYHSKNSEAKYKQEFRCFKCNRVGHLARNCRNKQKNDTANRTGNTASFVSIAFTSDVTQSRNNTGWCLDSGATSHMCNDPNLFKEIKNSSKGVLGLANNTSTKICGEGVAQFKADVRGSEAVISLNRTLHIPDLRANLLSVSRIVDHDFEVRFNKNSAVVLNKKGEVKLHADRSGDLYFVREPDVSANIASAVPNEYEVTLDILHRRAGHVNFKDIRNAVINNVVRGIKIKDATDNVQCDVCVQGKMSRSPFKQTSGRKTDILEIVHTDVCGPMRQTSIGGSRYYIEFIDDCSRWCEVKFLKSKSEALDATKESVFMMEKQCGKPVKSIQSDNGSEYVNRDFDEYLKDKGITRRLSVARNPEQNGISERKNRTLVDAARCLLLDAGLPERFWAEAVNTANYIRNRMPTRSLNGRTPFEVLYGKIPSIKHFRIFGSKVIYLDTEPGKGKFAPRGLEGVFLGYASQSKGYRIWSPKKQKVVICRDVKFFEGEESVSKSGHESIDTPHKFVIHEEVPSYREIEVPPDPPADQQSVISEDDFRGFDPEKDLYETHHPYVEYKAATESNDEVIRVQEDNHCSEIEDLNTDEDEQPAQPL